MLQVFGRGIVHVAEVGAGHMAKVANELVVSATHREVAEALALAEAVGVDAAKVSEVLPGGFAARRVLEVHGRRMHRQYFTPGFRARPHLTDARIIERLATTLNIPTPPFQVALGGWRRLADTGRGELGKMPRARSCVGDTNGAQF
jgi:2-hydroxy-3-oxopropionate reductase